MPATTRHTITRAQEIYHGNIQYAGYTPDNRAGIRMSHIYRHDFGVVLTLRTAGLMDAATSTELPNIATKTYTPLTDGTSPLDNANKPVASAIQFNGVDTSVYTLPTPRNVTTLVTHATSIVAVDVTVSGFDVYGRPMSELISTAATGTSTATSGKKAFKYISSMVITSAGNATTDTVSICVGEIHGLPFVLTNKSQLSGYVIDGAADTPTTVVAVTT